MAKEYYIVKDTEMQRYIYAEGKKQRIKREDNVYSDYVPYQDDRRREILNLDGINPLLEYLKERIKSKKMDPQRNSLVHLVNFSDQEVIDLRRVFKDTRIHTIPENTLSEKH